MNNDRDNAVYALAHYALQKGLIEQRDFTWAVNSIMDVLKLDGIGDETPPEGERPLSRLLDVLLDDAAERGLLPDNTVVYRDILDTELMGRLTPRPSDVAERFYRLFRDDPKKATDWYYGLCLDTNYIRRDRIARDMRWKAACEYGELDITVNLSKPEKDPKAIAAARSMPASSYPRCQLCAENEGYAGRVNHPARQNHRLVPISIAGAQWFFQYSPYVYYNEHCICLNSEHVPMKIDRACFDKLLDFVTLFPHYFVGSNADLPIVGGSILAHEHFQGGRYTFAMEKAPVETPFRFAGEEGIASGIVKWPMSVLRLTGRDPERLASLAQRVLARWREWDDEEAVIFSQTDGVPHNTITPIARRRGGNYELDLVLRNNLTTEQHPLGLYHPHAELHHIKKENIGLIEVMGLAVLPSRLKAELAAVADGLVRGADLRADELSEKHADWADGFRDSYRFTPDNALDIVKHETGLVFSKVLEHAGVYRRNAAGQEAFLRFLRSV